MNFFRTPFSIIVIYTDICFFIPHSTSTYLLFERKLHTEKHIVKDFMFLFITDEPIFCNTQYCAVGTHTGIDSFIFRTNVSFTELSKCGIEVSIVHKFGFRFLKFGIKRTVLANPIIFIATPKFIGIYGIRLFFILYKR